jgi:hypothetical protein
VKRSVTANPENPRALRQADQRDAFVVSLGNLQQAN